MSGRFPSEYADDLTGIGTELARKAEVSILTINRIEKGKSCRLDTKRKIIRALGLKLSEKNKVFRGP